MKYVYLFIFFLLAFHFSQAAEPAFSKYPVTKETYKFVEKIQFDGMLAKQYNKELSQQIKEGPNFAGKFRITQLTCGARECDIIALIDCTTGLVYEPKLFVIESPQIAALGVKVEHRLESRLLVLRGCLSQKSDLCGIHEFVLNGTKLKKIHFESVKTDK